MVEGVGGYLPIFIFFSLSERGSKIVVWYLVQHFGDWGYKIHFYLECCHVISINLAVLPCPLPSASCLPIHLIMIS